MKIPRLVNYFVMYAGLFIILLTAYDLLFETEIKWLLNGISAILFGSGMTLYRFWRS